MKYLLKHRIPNFIEHNPNELETKVIESLKEIHDFEFMTFHRLQGSTRIMVIEIEKNKYTDHDYDVYVYNPKDFELRTWVAKLYEIKDE